MKRRVIISMLLVAILSMPLFSNGTAEKKSDPAAEFIINETDTTVTYVDRFQTETTITKFPKRVVVCYNSIFGQWYFAGGKAVAKVKGKINVPEEAWDLYDLGTASNISLESIIALEPDLVILAANYESHVALVPILRDMGKEVMIIDTSINPYERFKENVLLFSKINGTEDVYQANITPVINSVNAIVEKTKSIKNKPKVAAIFASTKSLSLDSDIAITGEMVKALGGENIMKASDVLASGETRVDFSIEAIISQNPDIILFSPMGDEEGVKKNVEKMISANPVWNEVNAVKNGRVYFLPKEYFVYKANELYGEAFEYLSKVMYPEVFGEN